MTSQPGKQTIASHIFPNISRSKGTQTMKFGQLEDYIKINIFHEVETYWNVLKSIFRPLDFISNKAFLKKQKEGGTIFPASFSAWRLKENIALLSSFN